MSARAKSSKTSKRSPAAARALSAARCSSCGRWCYDFRQHDGERVCVLCLSDMYSVAVSEARSLRARLADEQRTAEQLRCALETFIELHSPRTPAQRRHYAEDERGWNLMLSGAVHKALALCPRDVELCEVCDGLGLTTCDCGDPEHECGGGDEVVCGRCDGGGEVPP